MEQLTQAQHRAAEALYKQTGAGAGAGAGAGSSGPSGASASSASSGSAGAEQGDVIDAEVVDEEKK
jgi:molecular chaperone DnaK